MIILAEQLLICLILLMLAAKSFCFGGVFVGSFCLFVFGLVCVFLFWGVFGCLVVCFKTESIKIRDIDFTSESREPGKLPVN